MNRIYRAILLACCSGGILLAADTPSPALLVLNKAGRSLAIVDPANLKVVAHVPVGADPHEVIASHDGRLAFASDYGGSESDLKQISVVDLQRQKALPAIDLGALRGAHGLAFAVGKLFFTAEVNKVIARYDPSSKQIDWILGTGQNRTHMVLVNRNVTRIFTSNIGSNSISIIEKGAKPKDCNETFVTTGKAPVGFDVSPDGKELWAANSGDGTVSIVSVPEKKVVQTIQIGTRRSNRLKFTPDGEHVLVSDLATGELVVLDAPGRKVIRRVKLGRGAAGILIQPDGSRAFVAVSPDNKVAVIDLKTLQVTGSVAPGEGPDGMAWVGR